MKRSTRTTTGGKTDTALQYDTTMHIQAEIRRVTGAVLWRNQNLAVSKSFGTSKEVVVTSSADFPRGKYQWLRSQRARFSRSRERAGRTVFADDQVAQEIYDQAVTPDF